MRAIEFDTGPLISLTLNNLLSIVEPLKERFKGHFHITSDVKREIIDKPLTTKKFKFEALQVLHYINNGTFEIVDSREINELTNRMLEFANNSFNAFGNNITIVQRAEISAVASCIHHEGQAVVVDERTTRLMVENPDRLHNILKHRLHSNVKMNSGSIKEFSKITKGIRMIRSVELVTMAYEMGMLDQYIAEIPDSKKMLLEGILWGVKLQGCAVSRDEIEQIMRMELKGKN